MRHPLSLLALALSLLLVGTAPAAAKRGKKPPRDAAVLTGQITSVDGAPVPGAEVVAVPKDGEGDTERTKADDEGRYELVVETPSSGDYAITASHPEWSPFEATLVLGAASRQEVNFRLLDLDQAKRQSAIEAYNRGTAAHSSGDLPAARTAFEEAIAADATLPQPHLGLADTLRALGEMDAAIRSIERFRELAPDDATGRQLALELYQAAGLDAKAAELVATSGDSGMVRSAALNVYNQGAVATQKGDWPAALALFEQAVATDPTFLNGWRGLVTAAYQVGEMPRAIVAADELLAVEPENEAALRIRWLALDAEERSEADAAWEAFYAVDEDTAVDLLARRADLQFRSDDVAGTRAASERILARQPDHARSHYLLGLLDVQRNPAEAKKHLQRFVELAPDDPDAPAAQELIDFL